MTSCSELDVDWRYNEMSSAYKLIHNNHLVMVIGQMPWILWFCRIATAKASMNMANSDGESVHPCLVPLCKVNGFDIIPLVMTVAMGEEYSVLIQCKNDSLWEPPSPHAVEYWGQVCRCPGRVEWRGFWSQSGQRSYFAPLVARLHLLLLLPICCLCSWWDVVASASHFSGRYPRLSPQFCLYRPAWQPWSLSSDQP